MVGSTSGARVLKSGGILLYSRAVMIAGQIATVPILATRWGAGGYGEWLSLTAVASYISYSGAGLAPAVRSDMAMGYGIGGLDAIRPTFQTAMILIAGLAVAAGLVLPALNFVAPIVRAFRFHYIGEASVAGIIVAISLQISLTMLNGALSATLSALGRYHITNAIDAMRQSVEIITLVICVGLLRAPPSAAAWIFPVSAALTMVGTAVMIGSDGRQLFRGRWVVHREVLARLWHPMIGALILILGYNGLMVQGPRVILAVTVGPVGVATFSVAVMLLRLARIPMEVPGLAVVVELAGAYSRGDLVLARKMLGASTRLTFWLALLMVPGIVVLGPAVVRIWSNGRLHVDRELIAILAGSTLIFSMGLSCLEGLLAVNRISRASAALLALSVPFGVACWLLSKSVGAVGAGIAVAGLESLFAVVVLFTTARIFHVDGAALVKFYAPPSIAGMRQQIGVVWHARRQK